MKATIQHFATLWGIVGVFWGFLILAPGNCLAQHECGSDTYWAHKLKQHPEWQENRQAIERHTEAHLRNNPRFRGGLLVIPVVVNVVYRLEEENIPDEQILAQINALNEDFRRWNADADNSWPQAADTKIEFCLASVDPEGNPTTGIRREKTSKTSFSFDDGVKSSASGGLDPWPSRQYLNIWVCRLNGLLMGYSQYPGGDPATDGVVIHYAYFGKGDHLERPYHLGRTTTHEVGHWLNLLHLWGEGDCNSDDLVEDTPRSNGPNLACIIGYESCGSTDMLQNYMNFTDDACMNLFTWGQAERMRALFAPGGFRESLLSSPGCVPQVAEEPMPTCADGEYNGKETGVDCGGPDCPPCILENCPAPENLLSTPIRGGRYATLTWDPVPGVSNYTVQMRRVFPKVTDWTAPFSTAQTSVTASRLAMGQTYQWRIQTHCEDHTSLYATRSFVAGRPGRTPFALQEFHFFPNPANDILNLYFTPYLEEDPLLATLPAEEGNFTISLLDLTGKKRLQEVFPDGSNTLELDISRLANGLYFIHLTDPSGAIRQIRKLVVAR